LRDLIGRLRPRLTEIFEHLHANPELSWQEFATRDYLLPILEAHGCRIRTFDDHPGIVADLGDGEPRVAVRGDMDALWQEVDGTERANHSCGHDAHMTMALGVMMVMAALEDRPAGAVRILFQPAEEKAAGALKLVEEGALDGITHLFGVHLRPIEDLPNGTAGPAIYHGASTFWYGEVDGDDAHGARPHLTANAIEVCADLVHLLNGIHLNPMVPHSVKMTRIEAGGSSANIIPGKARFSLDLRAQTNDAMKQLVDKVHATVAHLSGLHGVPIHLKRGGVTAAAEVHPEAEKILADAIFETLGKAGARPAVVTSGGDDFHFYTIERPSLIASMLALGCGLEPGLHHPKMRFDRESLFTGTEILARAVLTVLAR